MLFAVNVERIMHASPGSWFRVSAAQVVPFAPSGYVWTLDSLLDKANEIVVSCHISLFPDSQNKNASIP
jgi:hypothetical protein